MKLVAAKASSDSDEEWTPALDRETRRSTRGESEVMDFRTINTCNIKKYIYYNHGKPV